MVALLDRLLRGRSVPAGTACPPSPPPLPYRVVHGPYLAGLGALAVLPALMALGVLERDDEHRVVVGERVAVEAHWPSRMRFRQHVHLRVAVTNRSPYPEDVAVTLDRAWIEAFDGVRVVPEPEEAWVIRFDDVPPGETRHVVASVQGERRGRVDGLLAVRAGDELVELDHHTFLLP